MHIDQLYQAYQIACLILLSYQTSDGGPALSPTNPYISGAGESGQTQDPFATFGGAQILALVGEVSERALKAVWRQKWIVHRRLRPEVYAARIHYDRVERSRDLAPLFQDLPFGTVIQKAARLFEHSEAAKNWLLPLAFPEGSPLHPAYGAGHATVAGACTTVLKAWFDGARRLGDLRVPKELAQNPSAPQSTGYGLPLAMAVNEPLLTLVASADGLSLAPVNGGAPSDLTIEGELNKLAANVGIGRNIAGVHWRTDHQASIELGERVALELLADYSTTFEEEPAAFRLNSFRGVPIEIKNGQVLRTDRDTGAQFDLRGPKPV